MNFVAIDFETATSKWTSICSMGLCVVEENKIVERKEFLVRPTPFEFNKYNTKIHGITPDMVCNMPTFDMYWNSIYPYMQNNLVVAHNTSFDINVLRTTLDEYGIDYPSLNYLCTVELSQKAYPDLPSHKLNAVSEMLNVSFSHHNACDDAYACAKILLSVIEDFDLSSLEKLQQHFQLSIGQLYPGVHIPRSKSKKQRKQQ